MNLFTWLFIGHLVGDFLLQTNWMATRKKTDFIPLITHVLIYTLSVYAFSLFAGGISYKAVALVFISHIVLDRREFVKGWVRLVNKAEEVPWLLVVSDQCWHFLILAFATMI